MMKHTGSKEELQHTLTLTGKQRAISLQENFFLLELNFKFDKFNELKRLEVKSWQQRDLSCDLESLEAHSHHQLDLWND